MVIRARPPAFSYRTSRKSRSEAAREEKARVTGKPLASWAKDLRRPRPSNDQIASDGRAGEPARPGHLLLLVVVRRRGELLALRVRAADGHGAALPVGRDHDLAAR